jgi:F0F1-type ATP synthase assembly protein I
VFPALRARRQTADQVPADDDFGLDDRLAAEDDIGRADDLRLAGDFVARVLGGVLVGCGDRIFGEGSFGKGSYRGRGGEGLRGRMRK